jgi:predicted amidohydrolase
MAVSSHSISVMVSQYPVALDIRSNLAVLQSLIARAEPEALLLAPEGALSGYADDPAFLAGIDRDILSGALKELMHAAMVQQVHLIFGSCVYEAGAWYNAGLYYGPRGERGIYRKVNLATHERGTFRAGAELPVFRLVIGGQSVQLGLQLCREIRFPEQWQYLARAGVEVFAYLTNAVGDAAEAPVWRSHLVSRAAENQRFVLGANTADSRQKCPSMIITPRGHVVWEACSAKVEVGQYNLDLALVSNWYVSQSRRDVVEGRE